jgi:two-component system sensor histidine kinase FlrB
MRFPIAEQGTNMTQQGPCQTVDLEQAFRQFNQASEHLSASYRALESRISLLNEELAAVRDERLHELAEKERLANRLSRLLNALPCGVVVLDGEGRVQEANPAAITLLGEPLSGQMWRTIIERAFQPQPTEGFSVALRDGRLVSIEISLLGDEPGQILLFNDITEERLTLDRLAHHKRLMAVGEMAAGLAHQIRTPLASALLYVSQLTQPAVEPANRQRIAGKIQAGLKHLEKLVNDMLMFTRGGTAANELIPVAALLQDVRQLSEMPVQQGGCRLDVQDEAAGAVVCGNRDALMGALHNLLMNAIQACGQGGELCLHAQVTVNGAIDLTVTDNGPGITPEMKEKIFEPFFTTRAQGAGLGLAVVQAVARAHAGNVWLESEPGRGSTIGIRIPAEMKDAVSNAAAVNEKEQAVFSGGMA